MVEELLQAFKEQLPKPNKPSLGVILHYCGTGASIIGLGGTFFFLERDTVTIIYTIFLLILISLLLAWSLYRELSKENRFAQTVYYTHYVNHIIRDYFGKIEKGEKQDLKQVVREILTGISTCYSMVTGRACRICLKELKLDKTLITSERCLFSKRISHSADKAEHKLKDNTDFYNIWYAKEGCIRYYFCNNLPHEWKTHKYKNSSFERVGGPKVKNILGIFTWVSNWNLPYKSTIVLPIRYLKNFEPPSEKNGYEPPEWKHWGFLCIDCKSRGVFSPKLAPELGLAFADLLFVFFSNTDELINSKGGKVNDQKGE